MQVGEVDDPAIYQCSLPLTLLLYHNHAGTLNLQVTISTLQKSGSRHPLSGWGAGGHQQTYGQSPDLVRRKVASGIDGLWRDGRWLGFS